MQLGDTTGALATYRRAFDGCNAKSDHYNSSVIAHMAGVAEPDPLKKHEWNLAALHEADAVADRARVKDTYARTTTTSGCLSRDSVSATQRLTFSSVLASTSTIDLRALAPTRCVPASIAISRACANRGSRRRVRPARRTKTIGRLHHGVSSLNIGISHVFRSKFGNRGLRDSSDHCSTD